MVLAFCRRGLVIPICLYLLVGWYMKEENEVVVLFVTLVVTHWAKGSKQSYKGARRQRELGCFN